MPEWEKLDHVSKNISEEPWSLYWCENKSRSDYFEHLLHQPLEVLSDALEEVDKSWTVQSTIFNHEVGLNISAVCTIALVDPEKKLAYLTFYKH